MRTWEYLVEYCTSREIEEKLHQRGKEGWELVSAMPITAESNPTHMFHKLLQQQLIFKRINKPIKKSTK